MEFSKKKLIILLFIIVVSSIILERIHLYYPHNDYELVCEYMILPEDMMHVCYKGEIYKDRTMKCYVIQWQHVDMNRIVRQDVGPIEHSSEYVEVVDSNIVRLSEIEYRRVVDFANYLSGVVNDIPFDELGGYALGSNDVCIKYNGKWYDEEFTIWEGKGAGRLKPDWVDNSFLETLIKEKIHDDFWYDVADVFYEKSGFVYKMGVQSRPKKWK